MVIKTFNALVTGVAMFTFFKSDGFTKAAKMLFLRQFHLLCLSIELS
jgi:hypothetical protein